MTSVSHLHEIRNEFTIAVSDGPLGVVRRAGEEDICGTESHGNRALSRVNQLLFQLSPSTKRSRMMLIMHNIFFKISLDVDDK